MLNKVFLIDDDFITNIIHTKVIKIANFAQESIVYTNANEALQELSKLSDPEDFPELIFVDINMPLMDGWEFLEALEKLSAHIAEQCHVIVLSTSIDPDDIDRSKSFKNVLKFISKPLTPMELSTIISDNILQKKNQG